MGSSVYIDTIGDGSQGFVADPDNTGTVIASYKGGWMHTNYPRCRANGEVVDVTDTPVGEGVTTRDWEIERTEDGLRARSKRGVRLRG